MKECVFCEIVRGTAPAHQVYQDEQILAFLDNRPFFPGHVLVVPRHHVVTLAELEPAFLDPLFRVARRLSQAVPQALEAQGSFVAMNNLVSQSVPHLHVQVVPRKRKDGLRGFFWPRNPYRDHRHAQETAAKIAQAMASE